ncbi:hypothetical protein MFIFM68171_01216 [Madurella fahalii]|uniref:Uncharacterized protein n=1 Tax=Madurella fahalii TaxID=1157608 RepID=A0ABQ0FZS0_9PEZI
MPDTTAMLNVEVAMHQSLTCKSSQSQATQDGRQTCVIDYLVSKSNLSWDAALRNPWSLKDAPLGDIIKEDKSLSFTRTWWTSGRCTSFTLRVVRQLQEYDAASFDFKFYDLNGHRVARCAKTGILIDSSSAVEVLVLKDGEEWLTLDEEGGQPAGKWVNGKSKFERDNNRGERQQKVSGDEITLHRCMEICLLDIKKTFEPLCLFRSFENGRAKFNGMIKWQPAKHNLILVKKLGVRDNDTIVFDKDGNEKTEKECVELVRRFVVEHGNEKQWRWGQETHRPCDIHDKLWEAAKVCWGRPRKL